MPPGVGMGADGEVPPSPGTIPAPLGSRPHGRTVPAAMLAAPREVYPKGPSPAPLLSACSSSCGSCKGLCGDKECLPPLVLVCVLLPWLEMLSLVGSDPVPSSTGSGEKGREQLGP